MLNSEYVGNIVFCFGAETASKPLFTATLPVIGCWLLLMKWLFSLVTSNHPCNWTLINSFLAGAIDGSSRYSLKLY